MPECLCSFSVPFIRFFWTELSKSDTLCSGYLPFMILHGMGHWEWGLLWWDSVSAFSCALYSLCSPCPWLTRNSRLRSPSSSMPWEATPPWPKWTSVGMEWGTWEQRCWPKHCRSILSREPNYSVPRFLAYKNCEIINRHCSKLLKLWLFITQQQKTNTPP